MCGFPLGNGQITPLSLGVTLYPLSTKTVLFVPQSLRVFHQNCSTIFYLKLFFPSCSNTGQKGQVCVSVYVEHGIRR